MPSRPRPSWCQAPSAVAGKPAKTPGTAKMGAHQGPRSPAPRLEGEGGNPAPKPRAVCGPEPAEAGRGRGAARAWCALGLCRDRSPPRWALRLSWPFDEETEARGRSVRGRAVAQPGCVCTRIQLKVLRARSPGYQGPLWGLHMWDRGPERVPALAGRAGCGWRSGSGGPEPPHPRRLSLSFRQSCRPGGGGLDGRGRQCPVGPGADQHPSF